MTLPTALRLSEDRATTLKNETCPYCGNPVSRRSGTKEHVIARRFVPHGAMDGCWNLILRACRQCNNQKSDLEDDLSAITMAFHAYGLRGMDDDRLKREVQRKALRSISRKTGKLVGKSSETVAFSFQGPVGIEVSGNFSAPPQMDEGRVFALARLQLTGLFYMLTYDTVTNRGHWWEGGFLPLHGAIKTDWGNPIHRHFMREVEKWDYRLIVSTADGYFRVAIRKHHTEKCWSWALEWNNCYRLVGYFGDEEIALALIERTPKLRLNSILESGKNWIRVRNETPIPEDEDVMFVAPEDDGGGS
jgi:hypothetical protein